MMRRRATTPSAFVPLVVLALTLIAGLSLSACGGGEDRESTSTATTGTSHYIVKSRDRISSSDAPAAASVPAGEENDEESSTGAGPVRPCSLVSAEEASSILGAPVRVTTGPQGPTCIYTVSGSGRVMTLVVERTDFASLRNHAATATRVSVGGRSGWCLRYGSTAVAVPLADGSVLNVTGPCADAARFAARALPRISS